MDAVYLAMGKIVAVALLWYAAGIVLYIAYMFMYGAHNGCWACLHGDIQDPIALWIALGCRLPTQWMGYSWQVPLFMPIVFIPGLWMFAQQVARDREPARVRHIDA